MAHEEKQPSPVLVRLSNRKANAKTNSVLPSINSPLKKGETTPSSRGQLSFERWEPSFQPSKLFTHNKVAQRKGQVTLVPEAHRV